MKRETRTRRCSLGARVFPTAAICLLLAICPAPAHAQPTPQEQELRRQLEIERAARKALSYQADMRQAAGLAETEEWSSLATLLNQYRPAPGESDLRAWEWHFLDSLTRKKQLVDRQEVTLQGPTEGVRQLAWSGDSRRLAALGEDGSAVIWDLKTSKELRRLGARVRFTSLDHTGRRIALSIDNGTVTLWDTDKGPARRFFGPIPGLTNFRQPAFSPDGQRMLLAVEKTVAAVYDAATGRELHRLAGHRDFVSTVAWDPTGDLLATGSHDGTVKLWNAATGDEKATLPGPDPIESLAWSAQGRQLAAVNSRGQGTGLVRIWNVSGAQRIFAVETQFGATWRPNEPRARLFLSADGKRVAAESIGGATIWDAATGRPIFQATGGSSGSQTGGCDPEVRRWGVLQMFGSRATCRVVDIDTSADLFRVDSEIRMNDYRSALAWSPDGHQIAAGFSHGKVYVYRVPVERGETRMLSTGPASFFAWSPDGRRFAFAAQGEVRIGSLPVTERPIRLGAPLLLPSVVRLSPDGKYLAGADRDGTLPIWDVDSGQVATRLPGHPAPAGRQIGDTDRAATALRWSPDSKRLASLRIGDGGLRVWDVKTANLVTFVQHGPNQFDAPVSDELPLVWSPDSNLLAARFGSQPKKVCIFDVTTGKQTRAWDGGPDLGSSNAMAWDPTSKLLATCLGNPPRIRIWNVTTGAETLTLNDSVVGLNRLSFSPDGRRLAFQADKAQIYDFSTGRSTSLAGSAEQLVWNSDGSQLALVGNGSFTTRFGSRSVDFYDAATGAAIPSAERPAFPDPKAMKLERGVEGQNYQIQSLVWNNQGMRAAATAISNPGAPMIVVWDVMTGKPACTLSQSDDASADRPRVARMVAWSPDSRTLATLSGDSSAPAQITLWDAASGRKTQNIEAGSGNSRGAGALAFSPDGKTLAFAGQSLQVWNLLALSRPPLTLQQPTPRGPVAEQIFLAFSPDSRSLALLECRRTSGNDQVLKGWDLTTAREQFRWTRPYEFSTLHAPIAWSPDGKQIAWGGPKPGVWNVASGKEVFPLAGHSSAVMDVQWSADNRRVLSRCEVIGPFTRSFELKVWDAAKAQEIFMLRGQAAGWSLAPGFGALASPPGQGSDPGDVVVWDLAPRK